LAGIDMPDFHRDDDWWRHGGRRRVDLQRWLRRSETGSDFLRRGDVLICYFGSSVPNHAAIYCGDGELLHHIPEQLS
ncbi:hypothetical protein DNP89_23755, partial [Salmonella enterica subsp. enterica serovar Panama]